MPKGILYFVVGIPLLFLSILINYTGYEKSKSYLQKSSLFYSIKTTIALYVFAVF